MFELTYDGSIVFSGTSTEAVLLGAIVLVVLIIAIDSIWKKLIENNQIRYEFITIIAHKFRTPLTYIKWSSDGLIKGETDSFKKEGLDDIRKANESLIKLTGTLLELTESDNKSRASYSFERVDLCEFVRIAAEGYKGIFHEKNIFFSVSCSDEKVMVKVDRARMEYVLQVLFENARTYTPTGKNVEVGVGHKGHKAVITVRDHGIGISEKDQKRLFTKFFRAENARRIDTEGFGVGLYMARSVMRRLKGKIEAFSDGLDAGSTFVVTLKRVK